MPKPVFKKLGQAFRLIIQESEIPGVRGKSKVKNTSIGVYIIRFRMSLFLVQTFI